MAHVQGVCFYLYFRARSSGLAEYQLPELHGGSEAVTLVLTRVQGVCFHLYSKARSSGLAEYQLPELQRSPLDELSLQVMPWPQKLHAWHVLWLSLRVMAWLQMSRA